MRHRARKTNRAQFSKQQMTLAVLAVTQEKQSLREAARNHDVNYKTLSRYVKKHTASGDIAHVGYKKVRRVFSDDLEQLMTDYIKKAAQIYHGLTPKNIRELAFKMAKSNNVTMPKSWDDEQSAGIDWFQGFMRRNPTLSIRSPEPTSLARMSNFNRANVDLFFDNLEDVQSRGTGFPPESIYNIDETGVTTVQRPCKIVAEKGVKQVGATVSQERGTLVTLCCGANAIGNSIPPFFVFPRVNFQAQWLATAPPGSAATGHAKATGWMTSENFLDFMKHFQKHTKPSADHPVLLILDNHQSHISIDILDYAKEHHITILSFPPHCSHALQPLDRSVFGPLKTYLNQAMDNWMRDPQHSNQAMTIHVLPSLVAYAFPKAFTPQNITAGFRCTGIFPYDRHIFTDADFMASTVSDRPLPHTMTNNNDDDGAVDDRAPDADSQSTEAIPSTSDNRGTVVSPEVVRPFAKAAPRDATKIRRKTGKSAIYTDTPVKNAIAEEAQARVAKGAAKKKIILPKKKVIAKSGQRDAAVKSSSEESENEMINEQMEAELERSSDDTDTESERRDRLDVNDLSVDDHILVKFESE